MWSHVICPEAQTDLQALVAKDFLILAEDGVCEIWVKGINESESGL